MALLGLFVGVNILLAFRMLYKIDHEVRKNGSVVCDEHSFYRILWNRFRVEFHVWFTTSFILNFKEWKQNQEIQSDNFSIPRYKEDMIKIVRYEDYKQKRNDLFDFLYLGENEGIGNLE